MKNLKTLLATVLVVIFSSLSLQAQVPTCPEGQHWDQAMNMCMPDDAPVECPKDMHWSVEEDQCVPNNCPVGQTWNDVMKQCLPDQQPSACDADMHWDQAMGMCMPNIKGKTNLNFHMNQFLIGISGSGPRGRTALSAPNMFMLSFEQQISKCDSVKVDWMGTTDKWTTPAKGTPNLLQTGEADKDGNPFIDAQHPHNSPIMGLTFAVVHCLGKEGKNTFTLSFAPRGEATAGPQAFMHRASSDGNPNAPLGHHLQDVFHIISTVLAAKLQVGKWTIEGSVFSGKEPSPTEVNLDINKIDSGAVRISKQLNNNVTVGGSVASVLETHRIPVGQAPEAPERSTIINGFVYTNNKVKGGTLNTSTIYGHSKEPDLQLKSFLEELRYTYGKLQRDSLFGRFEVLQKTPDQLEIIVVGNAKKPEWVKALTVGYERKLLQKKGAALYAGGSITRSFVPTNFQTSYGNNPMSGQIHLRVTFMKNKSWGKLEK